jgi:murein DD-endopeptidase MepM/ murein hydrolase activator NlpD
LREVALLFAGLVLAVTDGMSPPIRGLNASQLHDSFSEEHNGHRHDAIDIMAPRGTPVQAVVDGTIAKLFLSKPGGLTIYEFDRAEDYCYYYAHLDRYADGLRDGSRVFRGEVIAYAGSSGNADAAAPHLHFEIHRLGADKRWWTGTPINPYPVLLRLVNRQ